MKMRIIKRILFGASVLLMAVGFLIATYGDSDNVLRFLRPGVADARSAFHRMMQGHPIEHSTTGYKTLCQALSRFAQAQEWKTLRGDRMGKVTPVLMKYEGSLGSMGPYFIIALKDGREIRVSVNDFKDVLDDFVQHSLRPSAWVLFVFGLLVFVAQHFIDVERAHCEHKA